MNRFKKRRLLKKHNLKQTLKDEWLAAVVHMSDRKLPPAFDDSDNYIDNNIGDILPMYELSDGQYAYYKIIKSRRKPGDWLYDTDAYTYDLEFSHIGDFKIRWD